jgi:hypothetical protein
MTDERWLRVKTLFRPLWNRCNSPQSVHDP